MEQLVVKTSKFPYVLIVLLGLFFVPFGVGLLIAGVVRGGDVGSLGIGFLLLLTFTGIVLLMRRGHRKSVKYFSPEGLVRNDGHSFKWSELNRVVNKVRITNMTTNSKALWRTEIQFKNGESARVIPTKVSNYGEVGEFINSLLCEHTEARA